MKRGEIMDEIMKLIDSAYRNISRISVRDMDVELMAASKQALREAFAKLSKLKENEVKASGQEN